MVVGFAAEQLQRKFFCTLAVARFDGGMKLATGSRPMAFTFFAVEFSLAAGGVELSVSEGTERLT